MKTLWSVPIDNQYQNYKKSLFKKTLQKNEKF
jgi:hypothetical protein